MDMQIDYFLRELGPTWNMEIVFPSWPPRSRTNRNDFPVVAMVVVHGVGGWVWSSHLFPRPPFLTPRPCYLNRCPTIDVIGATWAATSSAHPPCGAWEGRSCSEPWRWAGLRLEPYCVIGCPGTVAGGACTSRPSPHRRAGPRGARASSPGAAKGVLDGPP